MVRQLRTHRDHFKAFHVTQDNSDVTPPVLPKNTHRTLDDRPGVGDELPGSSRSRHETVGGKTDVEPPPFASVSTSVYEFPMTEYVSTHDWCSRGVVRPRGWGSTTPTPDPPILWGVVGEPSLGVGHWLSTRTCLRPGEQVPSH